MSRRHPTLARGPGRPRAKRGGNCRNCGRIVPNASRFSRYCSNSCACLFGRKRRAEDPVARERVEAPPVTEYVRALVARTGGRL